MYMCMYIYTNVCMYMHMYMYMHMCNFHVVGLGKMISNRCVSVVQGRGQKGDRICDPPFSWEDQFSVLPLEK